MSGGGKRIRPTLLLLACEAYGGNLQEAMPAAAAVEMFHNFTLLHDDIMDNAVVRRGKPSVFAKWGENVAILSGDAMLILAYRLMADCPKDKLAEVLSVFTETTMEICEGQQWDMEFETRMDVRVEEYIEMIRLKTSVLLAAALKIGAILAGAPAEDAKKLYDFGVCLGLAFQLQDDWLDVYGDPKVFGKNIGGDILCNKKTYMLITALEQADACQRKELEKWIGAGLCEPAEKVAAVTALYNEIGVGKHCQAKAEAYCVEALAILDSIAVPEEQKAILKEYACSMLNRNV
jgi:geranylgeranyl diphosphate synthase type II